MSPSKRFRATLGYQSRMERHQHAVESSAQSSAGYRDSVSEFQQHAAKPSPVHMEQIMKVDGFLDDTFLDFSLPSLLMLRLPQLLKMPLLNPLLHLIACIACNLPHLSPFNEESLPQPPSISGEFPTIKFAGGSFNSFFKVGSV